jgi:hypothetical protein
MSFDEQFRKREEESLRRLRQVNAEWDRQDRLMRIFWIGLLVWIVALFTFFILTGGPQ